MRRDRLILTALAAVTFLASGAEAQVQSWDKVINGTDRFKVLANFNNAAVLDKETGIVWERSPSPQTVPSWYDAQIQCARRSVGGRSGWRLPTNQELMSIVAQSVSPGPTLPSGHPFQGVAGTAIFWSANVVAFDSAWAWLVNFSTGTLTNIEKTYDSSSAWCVRGGSGSDPQ